MAIRVQGTTIIDDSRNFTNMESLNGVPISVTKPSIISPTDGSQTLESTITFQSSDFAVNLDEDTHVSSDWELATDSGFTNIVASLTDSTSNLTSWTVSNLPLDTYFVRVRHSGATLGDSEFSDVVSFSVSGRIAYAWGNGDLAGVGDGTVSNISSPVTIAGGFTDWNTISLGKQSVGIRNDGILYGWGNNYIGQVGDGTTTNRLTPVTVVGGITTWSQVSSGSVRSAAITSGGNLYLWGNNYKGSLGDGTTIDRSSPVTVAGTVTNWNKVAAGNGHCLGLTSDGILYAWGNNASGQLGTNNTTSYSSPVTVVGGITDWEKIDVAGDAASYAVRSNGELYSWGFNISSQLGAGSSVGIGGRSIPATIAGGITDWNDVSGGFRFAIAKRSNGVLYAWGSNSNGQLGDGTTTERDSPVTVIGGITDWDQISTTGSSSYALRSSGVLYAWGSNSNGQLGDGTTTNRSSPVTVVGGITSWVDISESHPSDSIFGAITLE